MANKVRAGRCVADVYAMSEVYMIQPEFFRVSESSQPLPMSGLNINLEGLEIGIIT